MDASMDIDANMLDASASQPAVAEAELFDVQLVSSQAPSQPNALSSVRDTFKDIPVKVHVRRPERDTWTYVGRAVVTLDVNGSMSQVVVRALPSNKILIRFTEGSELQAEKRGTFVVVGCVEGTRVVSWSLNALNNAETIRLLASIELACYRSKQAVVDPRSHYKNRRRVERAIKDDRRKRHRRRKEQDAMVDAFAKQNLESQSEMPPAEE